MRRLPPVVLAVLLGLALGVVPVAAHLNHVSVDDQVTDDGTLLVETVYVTEGSSWHVAVHAHNGSGPGEAIGHRTIDPGPKTAFTVSIDDARWEEFDENTTVWVALHRDDGDGTFEPDEEPVYVDQFGNRRAERISVGKRASGRVNVIAHGFSAVQTVNESTVTIPRVRLAEPGAVTLHAVEGNESLGREVGRTTLEAGIAQNVTVQIDEDYFDEQGAQFELQVVANHGSTPVRVGGVPVSSRLGVQKGAGVENGSSDGGQRTATEDGRTADGGHHSSGSFTPHEHTPAGNTASASSPTGLIADVPTVPGGAALLALVAILVWIGRTRN